MVFTFACATAAVAGDEAPTWLVQASKLPVPSYDKNVDAVVLLHEQTVSLDTDGSLVTVERRAVRILLKEGKADAVASAFYLSKFSEVKDLEAWLIAPTGAVQEFGKKYVLDRISDPSDVYDEGRIREINVSSLADTGYVFGFTSTTKDRPLFYQHQWLFQDAHPTLMSRLTIDLPAGWKASGMTFNRGEVVPRVDGSRYTWEVRDLPGLKYEPMSPTFANLVPRIAVNYGPAEGNQDVNKAFANWLDVSKWATAMYDPLVVVSEPVSAKARELTAGAATELDKIKAIGRFVQNMQYVAIDIGVGYGNGFRPRPSDVVLARGYGDCKDKANLMRAMLRSLGIESFPVAIYSGDPNFVRAEWASPRQFNHCIIAVRVSAETKGPTVTDHPSLGRLLIFDATDAFTPVGDLPEYLQGSKALIMAGENGGLIEMPVTPAEFNAWNRETRIAIDAAGGIKGTILERTSGQESREPRSLNRSVSALDFRKAIERTLTRGATAAKLVNFSVKDGHDSAAFGMDIEFSATGYGQLMQDRLLVFKPVIVNRNNRVTLTDKDRVHPVKFESNSFVENVEISLPAGFEVDEMPDPVDLAGPFGSYKTAYEVKDGKLYFSRSLITKRMVVGVEKYAAIRDFFSKMHEAEQSPVVLIRK